MSNRLGDDDMMPFGQYGPRGSKGHKRLADIPLSYFRYLYSESTDTQRQSPLFRYIALAIGEKISEEPIEVPRPRYKDDGEERNPFDEA